MQRQMYYVAISIECTAVLMFTFEMLHAHEGQLAIKKLPPAVCHTI
jgi:hypothetical protein